MHCHYGECMRGMNARPPQCTPTPTPDPFKNHHHHRHHPHDHHHNHRHLVSPASSRSFINRSDRAYLYGNASTQRQQHTHTHTRAFRAIRAVRGAINLFFPRSGRSGGRPVGGDIFCGGVCGVCGCGEGSRGQSPIESTQNSTEKYSTQLHEGAKIE